MDFPQYRKLSNNKVYYKIKSDRSFEEIQLVGNAAFLYKHDVSKYPELLRIKDMLQLSFEEFVNCTMDEFEELKGRII